MTMEKELAARKSAAKYSTDLKGAVKKYAELTGQLDTDNEVRDEMLSLLPLYRHPTADIFGEYMQFIDYDCMEISMTAYQVPLFLNQLKKTVVEPALIEEIKLYVEVSEQSKNALSVCQSKLTDLENILSDVQKVYDKYSHERSEKRNSRVVQVLGLSTGKRAKDFDHKKLYIEYVHLVRKDGLSRIIAVEELMNKYLRSYDTILNILNTQRSNVIKKWKEKSPSLAPMIRKRLKGFVPQDR